MAQSRNDMTHKDKVDALRKEIVRLHAALEALTTDLKIMWDAMNESKSGTKRSTGKSHFSDAGRLRGFLARIE
jgi:hypothetical protein